MDDIMGLFNFVSLSSSICMFLPLCTWCKWQFLVRLFCFLRIKGSSKGWMSKCKQWVLKCNLVLFIHWNGRSLILNCQCGLISLEYLFTHLHSWLVCTIDLMTCFEIIFVNYKTLECRKSIIGRILSGFHYNFCTEVINIFLIFHYSFIFEINLKVLLFLCHDTL